MAISNAFTTMPVQNQLGSIAFPQNGLSKLEYFALEIFKAKINVNPYEKNQTCMYDSINDALFFIKLLDEKTKLIQNETENIKPLIQS